MRAHPGSGGITSYRGTGTSTFDDPAMPRGHEDVAGGTVAPVHAGRTERIASAPISEANRDPGRWYLLFQGIAAGNGRVGDAIKAARAERIEAPFQEPYTYAQVHTAGFHDDPGFCEQCDAAYR